MERSRARWVRCSSRATSLTTRIANPRRAAADMRRWMFLGGAILAEVTGTLSMKAALDSPILYVVMGVGYAAAFVLLSLTLRCGMPLGVAYGIWGATGVALTAVLSLVFFGEPLTPMMIAGIACIMVGVVLVETGGDR